MTDYTKSDLERIGQDWLERIAAADKRDEKWFKSAKEAEAIYLCEEHADIRDFNIVHSIVETTVPAIYNSTPNADVRPRHNQDRPGLKTVADILERAIAAQLDNDGIDGEVECLAQDSVLAGRGAIRLRFTADEEGLGAAITYENVSWRDYREGPAKRARNVPWRAFRHNLTMAEVERVTDPEIARQYVDPNAEDSIKESDDLDVWEIWCRETMKVYFVAADDGKVFSAYDDPLGLSGFFPCPEPVQPLTATGQRMPVCPYEAYRQLARELDKITRRINKIMEGLKVRGLIASDATDIEQLAEVDDNTLVPVANLEGLAALGGLEKAIVWWPIDQAITVLRELYAQRETTKQMIYEVTGISDIVRGQSDPRETLGAQQIKTEWGSARVKRLQRMIQRHIRDLFVMSAEIMASKFQPQELIAIAGVTVPEDELPMVLDMLSAPLDHYKIDVESDSTIRADLSFRRAEMTEFLQGTAAYFGTMAPIIEKDPAAAEPAAEMYAAFARQFILGKTAEDAIDKMVDMARAASQQTGQAADGGENAIEAAKLQQEAETQQMRHAEKMAELDVKRQQLQLQQMQMMEDRPFRSLEAQIKAGELELKAKEQNRKDDAQDFDQMKDVAELQMERNQVRPVKIGDG